MTKFVSTSALLESGPQRPREAGDRAANAAFSRSGGTIRVKGTEGGLLAFMWRRGFDGRPEQSLRSTQSSDAGHRFFLQEFPRRIFPTRCEFSNGFGAKGSGRDFLPRLLMIQARNLVDMSFGPSPVSSAKVKIYLCGRSRYELNDTFFTMPAGTSVAFYGHYLRAFPRALAAKILSGWVGTGPERIIEQFESCPDLNLYEDDEAGMQEAVEALAKNPGGAGGVMVSVRAIKSQIPAWLREELGGGRHSLKLSKVCAAFPGCDLVWLASSSAGLDSAEYQELPENLCAMAAPGMLRPLVGGHHAARAHAIGEAEEAWPHIEDHRANRNEPFASTPEDRTMRPTSGEMCNVTRRERYERMIANAVKAARHRMAPADERRRGADRSLEAMEPMCR